MSKYIVAITFKKIGFSLSTKSSAYYVTQKEFNDEAHCTNWINKYGDSNYRKYITHERVYSIKKEHSIEELKLCWEACKSEKFSTFEDWYKFNFRKPPE